MSTPPEPSALHFYGVDPYAAKNVAEVLWKSARQEEEGVSADDKGNYLKLSKYLAVSHLKYYFRVDTSYVLRKIGLILFPFAHRDWSVKVESNGEPLSANEDVNAPDLYIPLMAFITYILAAGIALGINKRFTPEKLGLLTMNALFYLAFENALVFGAKHLLNVSQSLNAWQSLAYSSYKFVGVVFCLLLYFVGGLPALNTGLVYTVISTVFFLLRSLKSFILDMGYALNGGGRKRKISLLTSMIAMQSLMMWLLTKDLS